MALPRPDIAATTGNTRLTLIALCCAAFSQPVLATATPVDQGDAAIERISVSASPIRDSQEESIARQREATQVVNVIASDDIGRFPDQTAAAALARLPAVAVQRDQGQERYIQVRGAPARWTSVAFDGINVLGAEERVFRFDSVPASVMSAVEVSKTLTPDMPAEALAGRVNILTFSPLSKTGWNADFDLGLGRMQLGGGDQQRQAGRVSWSDGEFGAMVTLSQFEMEQITDNNETRYDPSGAPRLFDFRNYQLVRETNSAMLKLEYAPNEQHTFRFSSLDTEFLDHELRNMYQLNLSKGVGNRGGKTGELVGVPVQAWYQDGNYANSTFVNTLSANHQLTAWTLDWALNYTETESSFNLPIVLRSQIDPSQFHSLSYDMNSPQNPRLQLYSTLVGADKKMSRGTATQTLNINHFGADNLLNYLSAADTDAITLKLDASHNWQLMGSDAELKLGAQHDNREADSPGLASPLIAIGSLAAKAGVSWTPDQFITGTPWETDFDYGFGTSYFDNTGLKNQLVPLLDQLTAAKLIDPAKFYSPDSGYQVEETLTSVYGMNTLNWQHYQLLVGVRAERSDINSTGFLATTTGAQPVAVEQSATDWFPSIHLNIELTDELKARIAAVTGTSRPSFSQLKAGASVNDINRIVSGGNPQLKAEQAMGLDSSIEWYFADAALLALHGFYRSIDHVLFDAVTKVNDSRFNSPALNRQGYDYSTTLNGSNGKIAGLELSYIEQWDFLPDAIKGLGLQFNLALLDSEFKTPEGRIAALPGTSDQVINTSLFYENHGWSGRLTWQWRDKWLDDISPDAASDLYWQDSARLDFSVRYQFDDQWSVYFDANNLTDELGVRYEGTPDKPIEVEGYGRRYLVGVRASF